MSDYASKAASAAIMGKKMVAIGFGSNYFHQFTDEAVLLDSHFSQSRCIQEKNLKKEIESGEQRDNHNVLSLEEIYTEEEDAPNGFIFPLDLKEEEINREDFDLKSNEWKRKEKLSAPQRMKRLMKWRRKSWRQKHSKKDNEINKCSSNSSHSSGDGFDHSDSRSTDDSASHDAITSMSAGLTHNALIAHGEIYITGTLHGKLYLRPTIQRPKIPFKCTQISCGKRHVLALFENKITMSMGSGYFGQLGHGLGLVHCEELTIIERLSPRFINGEVVRIEAGGMHSAAIVTKDLASWKNRNKQREVDTRVFRWGSNRCGQCAIDGGKCNTVPYPTPMVEVRHPETGKKVSFVALSLSKLHSVGISHHGHVYSWGMTGRCGHGDASMGSVNGLRKSALKVRNTNSTTLPKRVEALKNIKIAQISVGDAHTLALSESGRVFSWGSNSNGQLGFGHTMHILTPRSVADLQFGLCSRGSEFAKEALSKAAEEMCTKDSSVYPITDKEQMHHKLSTPFDLSATTGHIHYPSTPQKNFTKKRSGLLSQTRNQNIMPPFISSIYASGSYSVAISSSGDLYTWGCAECDQLGHSSPINQSNFPNIEAEPVSQSGAGFRIRDSNSFDSKLNVLIPRRVECFRQFGLKVESISASPHFMIAICSEIETNELNDDRVYSMGKTLYEHEKERWNNGLNCIRMIRSPAQTKADETPKGKI